MSDEFEAARNVLSEMFGVPSSWFVGPQFVINLVIPFIFMTFFFYSMLKYKVRILRRAGTAVILVISVAMAFFSIPIIVWNPYFIISFSVFAIVMMYRGGRISLKRLIAAFVLAALAGFLAGALSGQMMYYWNQGMG